MKISRIFVTGMLITASMLMAYASGLMSYMFYTAGLKKGTDVYMLTALLVITLESAKYLLATFRYVFNGKVKHLVGMLLNILLVLSIMASINYFMLDTKGYNPATNFVNLLADYTPIESIARHLTLVLNISLSLVIEVLVIKFPQLIPNIWGKQSIAYEPFFARVSRKLLTYYGNRFENWVDKHVGNIEPSKPEPVKLSKPDVKQIGSKEVIVSTPANMIKPSKPEPVSKQDVNLDDIIKHVMSYGKGNIVPTGEVRDKFNLTRSKWETIRNKLKEQNVVRTNKTKLEVVGNE